MSILQLLAVQVERSLKFRPTHFMFNALKLQNFENGYDYYFYSFRERDTKIEKLGVRRKQKK